MKRLGKCRQIYPAGPPGSEAEFTLEGQRWQRRLCQLEGERWVGGEMRDQLEGCGSGPAVGMEKSEWQRDVKHLAPAGSGGGSWSKEELRMIFMNMPHVWFSRLKQEPWIDDQVWRGRY